MKAKVQAHRAVDVNVKDVLEILERARERSLTEEEAHLLRGIAESYAFVLEEIADKDTTIRQLREMLFGSKTEKTRNVLPKGPGDGSGKSAPPAEEKPKPKGHGRNAAEAYTGAERVAVPHESLSHGDRCPECQGRGKLYRMKAPAFLVRVRGVAFFPVHPKNPSTLERNRLRFP